MKPFLLLSLGLTIGLAAAALPEMATAETAAAQDVSQRFTVEPGLYESTTTVIMSGQTVVADVSEDCVREGENSKTLEEMVEEIKREGNCTLSNISVTDSTGRADFICQPEGMPFEASGVMEVEHGSDFLNLDATGTMGFLGEVQMKTEAKRIGACPVDGATP